MKIKLWTLKQSEKIEELLSKKIIPVSAADKALDVLTILDEYYKEDREVDNDDGGYLLLYTECMEEGKEIQGVLDEYHVPVEDAELEDVLCSIDGVIWKSVLYLVTNDFGITLIYPCKGGVK